MSRWLLSGTGPRWVLLLGFYVAAAGFQVWMRPGGATPAVISWAVYLGVGPALTAILLSGTGAWLAVFFGALFAQALIHGTALIPIATETTLVQCDIIVAAVATLQAVLGARLLRSLYGVPLRIGGQRDAIGLLIVGGPLVGLLGFLAACIAGSFDHGLLGPEILASGLIGWVVGIASTYIVLPLALLHPWRESSLVMWRGLALPKLSQRALSLILLSLALSGTMWGVARHVLQRHNQAQFAALAHDATAALKSRIDGYGFGLDAATALIRASTEVTQNDWRSFVGGLGIREHLPGVDALGFVQLVPRDQLLHFVKMAQADGNDDFTVHPLTEASGPLMIVRHVAPASARAELLGLKLGSDPALRRAALKARDLGETQLTPELDPGSRVGRVLGRSFVLLNPVFIPGVPLINQSAREGALLGWTFAVFSARELTQGVHGALGRDMNLTLAEVGGGRHVFYRSTPGEAAGTESVFRATDEVMLYGQPWALTWTSTPGYERGLHRLSPALVLLGGLAFTVLLAAFLLSHARREELIQQNVARKTREIAQREAETRSILETALVKIALLDGSGRIIAANDAACRSFGLRPEALVGTEFDTLMEGATAEYFRHSRTGNDLSGYRGIIKVVGRAGEMMALDVQIKAWTTEEGARRHTAVMRNVSDVLRVEAQLRDTQNRLDIALHGAQIGVFDVDLRTGVSIVSDTWRDLMGFDRATRIETQSEWKGRLHPEDRAAVEAADAACIAGEIETSVSDYRVRVVNGDWRWMRSHAVVAERDENGRALRLIGVQMDVTEERILDRAKSEFVSTVSHELRTPLTSINGSLSLILNAVDTGGIPERMLRLLRIAQKNCDRLIPLVNDILDLEKVSSGQTRFDFTDEDLAALLQRAVADNAPYGAQFGVTFTLLAEPGGVRGRVDVNRFLQVMANLLSNAAKFSERGGEVTVRLNREPGALTVSVTDHGRGIPASFHDRIFRPFSQADSSSTRDKEGTGLGLNISKQIVERMGGTIGFRSVPDHETTFWFTVPQAARAQGQAPEMLSPSAGSSSFAPAPQTRAPARTAPPRRHDGDSPRRPLILHVEDDPDFAEIVAASFGDQAEIVHSDREFSLDALRSGHAFDLIVLESAQSEGADAVLLDAVGKLQPGVPVVALTVSDKAASDPRVAHSIIKSRTRFEEIVSQCLAHCGGAQDGAENARADRKGPAGRVVG